MATHKSAMKRARQSIKRRDRNAFIKAATKTEVRKALAAVDAAKDKTAALAALKVAEKALRKAASKGTIPALRAGRKTSRIALKINSKFA